MIQLVENAREYQDNVAIIDDSDEYAYHELLEASEKLAQVLLCEQNDLCEQRIAFIINPGFDYVKTQWAIWRAGGIAVPLHPKAPLASHDYVLNDAQVSQLVVDSDKTSAYKEIANQLNIRLITPEASSEEAGFALPEITLDRRAMIVYTSGTTGNPKGVVTTHSNIEHQITALTKAWEWSAEDHIINVLPMHHVHGIINVLSCALWSGATCEFASFDAEKILYKMAEGKANVFMVVPTIYYKLITAFEALETNRQQKIADGIKRMRLMVSGSAALPVSVLEKWREITGHTLLERYGMTEMGMAISNPYQGERRPGHIGQPLAGLQVKIVDEQLNEVPTGEQGEILVKGPNVFKEYWNKPEATRDTFTNDGWFRTGDVAIDDNGSYKIIGRSSIDIIKSGGYKLSALEIEEVMRSHPSIKDCAVVGLPDEEWGEIVAAGIIPNSHELDRNELKAWLSDKLTSYKMPRVFHTMVDLPRNAMGKVVKNELKKILASEHLLST